MILLILWSFQVYVSVRKVISRSWSKVARLLYLWLSTRSSIGYMEDLRIGGRWFDLLISQYSFQGLVIAIVTGFILLSMLSIVSSWKEYCAEYLLKELQESMDRCTGHLDISEILLKTALNTKQSLEVGQKLPGCTIEIFTVIFILKSGT